MKIAAITDDGETISQHFGRAQYYLVVTIVDGKITQREMREKLGHMHFANEPHQVEVPGQPHGQDPVSRGKHFQMAQAISDCTVLLCRGMGMGAYENMVELGIQPIVTDVANIEQAVYAYLSGSLANHVEKLH